MKKKYTLLVVEDNPADLRLIQELLSEVKQAHFELINAETLTEAKKAVEQASFDVIFLDLGLPDSRGINTFREIKKIIYQTPIIILTGLMDEEMALNCLKEDAQDYLNKGFFNSQVLYRAIIFAIERKKIEMDLEQYAAIVRSSSVAIYSKNLQGIITVWNKGAEKLYGYSETEIIGQPVNKLMPPEYGEDPTQIIKVIKEDKDIGEYETIHLRKDGKKINVIQHATPVKNQLQQVIGVSVISHDITHQKRIEKNLAIQFRIALSLSESNDINAAANNILKTLCEILNWPMGEFWAVDPKKNALKYVAFWHASHLSPKFEALSKKMAFHEGEDLPGYIWKMKTPISITDLSPYEVNNQRQRFFEEPFSSCVGFPIVFKKEILGIALLFRNKPMSEFDLAFKAMFINIGEQIGAFIKRKRLEGDLLYFAEHDILTGLANRKIFESEVNNEIIRTSQTEEYFAILFLDLDFFKKINDSFGHTMGDLLLQEIASRIRHSVRETDTVARFGGDEFAILLTKINSIEDVKEIANKILQFIAKSITIKQKEIFITATIGISIYPTDGKYQQILLSKADQAMYYAKEMGRNRYQLSNTMMSLLTKKQFILETQLHHALERNEMVLYYQPIGDVKTGKIVGIEALIRWQHPDGTLLAPGSFIPIAAQSNMIIKLGEWVLNTATAQFASWHLQNLKFASINISVHQLNSQLIKQLKTILNNVKIKPANIILEITEDTLMSSTKDNIALINEMKSLGVGISIDDFGSGYSSFNYLKTFQIHSIKIDQSFIRDVPSNHASGAIVSAMIAMGKATNINVIAEGVENEAQLNFLREKECDQFQGFYLCKPVPPDELLRFIRKSISGIRLVGK